MNPKVPEPRSGEGTIQGRPCTVRWIWKDEVMGSPRSPICPLCKSEFDINYLDFAMPFRCPECNRYLCVPRAWSMTYAVLTLVFAGIVCYALGFRGSTVFIAAVLVWLPVGFVLLFWTRHYEPPKLRPCLPPDGYSGPLGSDTDDPR